MQIEANLRAIGLTNSEIKVYLALIKLGLSSKGAILKEARIAPSKIYHVLDKLMHKGLVSLIIKNNVQHYAAAAPQRIHDFLEQKKNELEQQEQLINRMLPTLEALQKQHTSPTRAELFIGWKGLETVYSSVLACMKKGQTAYVLGASQGSDPKKTKRFFTKYSLKAKQQNLRVHLLFNENARGYVQEIEQEASITLTKKFLFKTTPVEIAVANNITAIIILKTEPITILIHDQETADSFITYFQELWKIAKQ